jgi:transcription-repair coupling factor (superfamily II helicase)
MRRNAGSTPPVVSERGLRRVTNAVTPMVRAGAVGGEVVVANFASPLVVAAFASNRDCTLVVTATANDAEQLRDNVAALWGNDAEVVLWLGWDTHPLERVSPDLFVMGRRHEVRWRLRQPNPPRVVITSVRALSQLLSPEPLDDPITIRRSDARDRDDLLAQFVAFGYRREHAVEHRGEFAVRGGIVDVWPVQSDEPCRVDFFGDEIERVTVFDVADQRSIRDVEAVVLFAAREWRPSPSTRERAAVLANELPWGRESFGRLADGALFDGMEGWLPWFVDEGRTIVDELPAEAAFVVVEPQRAKDRLADLLDEERELVAAVGRTWGVDHDLPLGHRSWDETVGTRTVDLSLRAVPTHAGSFVLPVTSAPVVQGDPGRLAAHVRTWSPHHRGVIAAHTVTSANHIADMLRSEGLDVSTNPDAVLDVRIAVVAAPLSHGFALDDPPIVVWGEADITGRRAVHRAPRSRARRTDGFFDDLAIGSYVVHRQYGVAKFSGSTSRAINGTTRDYLVLEFRDGRSYWPTDQIDALTPYTGGDAPSLSRMGSEQWQRSRAKARAAATIVAQELVELYRARMVATGFAFQPDTAWQLEMESLFPYTETADQARAIVEVKADMESPRPMDRLVCADVGFGKTEIAIRAVFKAVQDNKQAALLVPTTLLASQHFATLSERFAGFPIRVAMLSRFVEEREVRATIAGLADGSVDVVIGTHKLLDDSIVFKDLGLLVVDEEQRFGVTHKEAIKRRTIDVDVLTLSASPIPRTLEMAFTGIRDLSMVTTPPADRRPILTHVGEFDEAAVVEAVRRELLREGQVFYVHNRVYDIDEVAQQLARLVPDARIAVAHGQMDEGTLETIVDDFWRRHYDVLVCTTIVESGIDMPTVNTLIVDRADLLGLGQLHQLRGRVGRGSARAYAYLFHPRDRVLSETAYERLRTIGDNTALGSGFKIAMRDLEIRGAGNLIGHDQSGPIAAVGYDLYVQLVAEAVAEAKGIVPRDVVTVSLDVPGEANLPVSYVAAEDDRLEAYRRLVAVSTLDELADVRNEWLDRFGPLPAPAACLLELTELRVECLRVGVREVIVQPARVGVRSKPIAKLSPLALPLSQQLRLRRLYGPLAYDESRQQVRVELDPKGTSPIPLTALLRDLVPDGVIEPVPSDR